MRFAHVADIHLGYDQYGLEARQQDFSTSFRTAAKTAIDEGASLMLIPGDIFHSRSISPVTLSQAVAVLRMLKEAGVTVAVVEGNHDWALLKDRISWLAYLAGEGLLQLLRHTVEEGVFSFKPLSNNKGGYLDFQGCRIYGLGYMGSAHGVILPMVREWLDRDDFKGPRILMMHAGLEGIMPDMAGCVPRKSLDDLRGLVNYIALGHIHQGYAVDGFIFNPGSLETVSAPEFGKQKGMFIVDLDSNGVENGIDGSERRAEMIVKERSIKKRLFVSLSIDLSGASGPGDALSLVSEAASSLGIDLGKTAVATMRTERANNLVARKGGRKRKDRPDEPAGGEKGLGSFGEKGGDEERSEPETAPTPTPTPTPIPNSPSTPLSQSKEEAIPTPIQSVVAPPSPRTAPERGKHFRTRLPKGWPSCLSEYRMPPIVEVNLDGSMAFDPGTLDMDAVIATCMKETGALHVVLRNRLASPDFDFVPSANAEDEGWNRPRVENEVFSHLARSSILSSGDVPGWVSFCIDLKNMALAGPEPNTLWDRVAAFRSKGREPGEGGEAGTLQSGKGEVQDEVVEGDGKGGGSS